MFPEIKSGKIIDSDSSKKNLTISQALIRPISFTMPIGRFIEESDEETRTAKQQKNDQLKENVSLDTFSQTYIPTIGKITFRNSEINTFLKEQERRLERIRPSQKLLQMQFQNIKKEPFMTKKAEVNTLKSQDYKCQECKAYISKGFYLFKNNANFCNYCSAWFCSDCIAQDKRPIWWKALEKFDLTGYKVCKTSQQEIDSLYSKPILQLEYDSEVVIKHPVLYEFLLLKRQVHLLYDLMCVPEYLETQLKENMNLCLKPNILSLKNFYDINNGSLIKLLLEVIRIYQQHILGCEKCQKKGKICGICNSGEKMYVFDIKNTVLCERCNEMYHRRCLLELECEKCQHDG